MAGNERPVTAANPAGADTARQRLDTALVALGHYTTRARARDAIDRGTVQVDGKTIRKAGHAVQPDADITVADPAGRYVSRAALKLVAGFDHFGLDPAGKTALDIGASTGGFTQVLLERGASHVVAIDVGHDQMHADIAGDGRVTNLEGVNARSLDESHVGQRVIEAVVSDVSFISLKLALEPALRYAAPGSFAVLLVKPQFEAGKDAIGKGGLLKDASRGPEIADELASWLTGQPGWRALGWFPSPIAGGDGNHEFLLGGIKDRT